MKSKYHFVFKLLLPAFFYFYLGASAVRAEAPSFLDGERIDYEIKKFGVKLGEATLHFKGETKIGDEKALLVVFKAEGMNFLDEENVYLNPVTLYPVMITRDLNIWGKMEKIREVYDQANGAVIITKQAKGKTERSTINKNGPIDNIYAFLYRYRKSGTFKEGEKLNLKLPTADVVIAHDSRTTLKAGGRTFNAFYYKSRPDKYQLWFSTTAERLPLRIDGTMGIAKTSMIMKDFSP
jgi:hypothetical protein